MRWPWERETRQQAYGDAVVDLILSRAGGAATTADPLAIGAVEVAAGLWGRAFMAAAVLPASVGRLDAITPAVRELIGRQLVRRGECLFVIEVEGGRLRLDPATAWNVTGASNPSSWMYEVTRAGPSRATTTRRVNAERVVHLRWGTAPERPWQGVGPLEAARLTAALAGSLERRLSEETNMAAGAVMTASRTVRQSPSYRPIYAGCADKWCLLDSTAGGYGARAAARTPARLGSKSHRSRTRPRSWRRCVTMRPTPCWRPAASRLRCCGSRTGRAGARRGGNSCLARSRPWR